MDEHRKEILRRSLNDSVSTAARVAGYSAQDALAIAMVADVKMNAKRGSTYEKVAAANSGVIGNLDYNKVGTRLLTDSGYRKLMEQAYEKTKPTTANDFRAKQAEMNNWGTSRDRPSAAYWNRSRYGRANDTRPAVLDDKGRTMDENWKEWEDQTGYKKPEQKKRAGGNLSVVGKWVSGR